MDIPKDWQEELMLHDWKMMRVERCNDAFTENSSRYKFPNGIHLRFITLEIDVERAPAVVAALSDWEPKMKVKNGVASIKVNWDRYKNLTKGELEDFKWRIYSLDI